MFALIDTTTNNILGEFEDRGDAEALLERFLDADPSSRPHLELVEAEPDPVDIPRFESARRAAIA